MKTSILLIAALLLNTSLLVAEPLATIVKDINLYLLLGIEALLLFGYFANKWLKELNKAYTVDFGYLDIFVINATKR